MIRTLRPFKFLSLTIRRIIRLGFSFRAAYGWFGIRQEIAGFGDLARALRPDLLPFYSAESERMCLIPGRLYVAFGEIAVPFVGRTNYNLGLLAEGGFGEFLPDFGKVKFSVYIFAPGGEGCLEIG